MRSLNPGWNDGPIGGRNEKYRPYGNPLACHHRLLYRVVIAVIPKGSGCTGCPYEHEPGGMVPDLVHPNSQVFILRQNPGKNEVEGRRFVGWDGNREVWEPHPPEPLIGKTGHELESKYLPRAGLARETVSLGNVIRCRVRDSDTLPKLTDPKLKEAMIHCQRAYFRPPSSTRVICAGGEYALRATAGESEISRWRGWLLPYNPYPNPMIVHRSIWTPEPRELSVFVQFHEAFLFRAPWEKTAAQSDWSKLGQFLAGKWPEPFPPIIRHAPPAWPAKCAFDTEFNRESKKVFRYSLAYREMDGTPRVWVVDRGEQWQSVQHGGKVQVIFHNAPADLPGLNEVLGGHQVEVEDTMVLHSILWSDLEHTLDYLSSLYARTNAWKHLEYVNPVEYSAGDALGTWDGFDRLIKELGRMDPRLEEIYLRRIGLIPLLNYTPSVGIATNRIRAQEVSRLLQERKNRATLKAQASVGWPLNLGSPQQVSHRLYDVERVHLNPLSGRKRRV